MELSRIPERRRNEPNFGDGRDRREPASTVTDVRIYRLEAEPTVA